MKNRKAIILIVIVLTISLFTTGCMKKVNEKIGTKIGEKIIEKALGEDVKIDTKDKTLSISTKDGNLQMGESLEWPTEKMNPLPNPNVKVVSVSDQSDDQSTVVMVHFPDHTAPLDYLEKVKDLGFEEDSMSTSEGFYSYIAYGRDNSQVMITIMGADDLALGIITFTKNSDSAKDFFEMMAYEEPPLDLTGVDMTDEVPWPKDQMDKIPELEGKITNVTTSKDSVYIELEYVTRTNALLFIEEIKSLGFNIGATDVVQKDSIFFMAKNDKDYAISVDWSNNRVNISYAKL